MNRAANTDVDIHPLLQQRHSPYAFDPDRVVSEEDVRALFEAARWTMSSFNAQPWRYIVGVKARDEATWEKVHSVLVDGNKPWAANAQVLALGVMEQNFPHNGKPNSTAGHDLGAASACLTLEATARGLAVHQMAGIHVDAACEVFGLKAPMVPLTALAIGYQGEPHHVDAAYAERDAKPRERKPVSDIVICGGF